MIAIDPKTVLLVMVLLNVVNCSVLTVLWRQNRTRSPELGLWLLDYVMQFLGIGLIGLRGIVPDALSIVLANAFVIGGTFVLLIGLERYVGAKGRRLPDVVVMVAFLGAHAYLTFVQPSLPLRNVNLSLALTYFSARSAWLLLHGVNRRTRLATTLPGITFLGFVALSVTRMAVDLTGSRSTELFHSTAFDTTVMLGYQMLFVTLTFALVLMVSRRLLSDLEVDIVERRGIEEALKRSEMKYRSVFANVPDALVVSARESGVIGDLNESFCRMTGLTAEQALGKTVFEIGLWSDVSDRAKFVEALGANGRLMEFETEMRRTSGEVFPAYVSGELMELEGEEYVLAVIQDATDQKRAQARLRELSSTDPLTGLLNHRAFFSAADHRIETAGTSQVSLVYLDIDNLKAINDAHGHQEGNRALVRFAEVLRDAFREVDVVGRLGGDEFAVLAVSREPVTEEAIVARYTALLEAANASGEFAFPLDASAGVSMWRATDGAPNLQEMVRVADSAMYEVKRARHARAGAIAVRPGV